MHALRYDMIQINGKGKMKIHNGKAWHIWETQSPKKLNHNKYYKIWSPISDNFKNVVCILVVKNIIVSSNHLKCCGSVHHPTNKACDFWMMNPTPCSLQCLGSPQIGTHNAPTKAIWFPCHWVYGKTSQIFAPSYYLYKFQLDKTNCEIHKCVVDFQRKSHLSCILHGFNVMIHWDCWPLIYTSKHEVLSTFTTLHSNLNESIQMRGTLQEKKGET